MKQNGVSESTIFLFFEENNNPAKSISPGQTIVRSGGRRHPFRELDAGFFLLKKREIEMRSNATVTENYFSKLLQQNKIYHSFQMVLYPYIVDFLIPDKKLIIEIDGNFHNTDIRQQTYDMRRDKYLMSFGFGLWRFENKYVLENGEKIISEIYKYKSNKKMKLRRILKLLSRNTRAHLLNKFRATLVYELHENLNKVITIKPSRIRFIHMRRR